MLRKLCIGVSVVLMTTLWFFPANATDIDLIPTDDRYGEDTVPGGAFEFLSDGTEVYPIIENNPERRAAIEFDLSAVNTALFNGAHFISATLTVGRRSTNGGAIVNFYGYSGNGTVELADMLQTGLLVGSWNPGAVVLYTGDMTSFIASLLAGSATHAGFLGQQMTPDVSTWIYSKEAIENIPPTLTITVEYPPVRVPAFSDAGTVVLTILLLTFGAWFLSMKTEEPGVGP